jgi:Flp pilus assembly CpaE family ATPase
MSPADAGELPAASIRSLTERLVQAFPFSVLDLPSVLSPATASALMSADRVLLVVTPDIASLQSARVALQALNSMGKKKETIWPVLNMPGGVGGLAPEAVSRALERPPVATIPYEPGMLSALNARRPLMLDSPKSAAAEAIARLSVQLLS